MSVGQAGGDSSQYPAAIADILSDFHAAAQHAESLFNPTAEAILQNTRAIHVTAHGRSYHAGLVACNFVERFCRIPARIESSAGYSFRRPIVGPGTLFVTIAAPGERREALAALRVAKASGYIATLAVTTADDLAMLREADLVLVAGAGSEAQRASPMSFMSQLIAVGHLTALLARHLRPGTGLAQILLGQLNQLAELAREVTTLDTAIEAAAKGFTGNAHVLYVGQEGSLHPIAMDGAFQLKRASHLHAEALAASEMKYGSLALVNEDTPVIALVPNDELHEPLMAGLRDLRARRGKLHLFADAAVELSGFTGAHILRMPRPITYFQAPVAYSIALQMLAAHVTRQQTRHASPVMTPRSGRR